MTTTVTPSHMPPVLAIGGRSAYSQGGTRFIAAVCALASLALLSLPAAAVNKCTGPGGQITFQDAPCVGKGEALTVRPASGRGPAPLVQHASPVAERAPPNPPAAPAPVSAPAVASQTPLEREADMCLDWYKPLLRDPNGAYVKQVMKDKRVLSMELNVSAMFTTMAKWIRPAAVARATSSASHEEAFSNGHTRADSNSHFDFCVEDRAKTWLKIPIFGIQCFVPDGFSHHHSQSGDQLHPF